MRVHQDLEAGHVELDQFEYLDQIGPMYLSSDEMQTPIPSPYHSEFGRLTSPEVLALAERADHVATNGPMRTRFRSIIGVSMYIALTSCPESLHAVCRLARCGAHCREEHCDAALRILRYQYHLREKIRYSQNKGSSVIGFVDSDWSVHHSTAGWVVWVAGGPVLFASKRERCIVLCS